MKKHWLILVIGAILSTTHPTPLFAQDKTFELLAHRGLHQTFNPEGVDKDTCTAARIDPPSHPYIENTLESIQAALDLGADIIEFDVHPTIDNEFVVFHDWTLDCRTDGHGVVREQDSRYLKTLDVGYGYTADGGKSYPFRGKFIGAMPTLREVLTSFPHVSFLINIKSNQQEEGRLLTEYLHNIPNAGKGRLYVYGKGAGIDLFASLNKDIVTLSKQQAKSCLQSYILFGWSGHISGACHHKLVPIPANYQWLIWGWPDRFEQRLKKVGSRALFMGAHRKGKADSGIDDVESFKSIPVGFSGIVFTNRIDLIGTYVTRKNSQ